jgi:hypothetical protein
VWVVCVCVCVYMSVLYIYKDTCHTRRYGDTAEIVCVCVVWCVCVYVRVFYTRTYGDAAEIRTSETLCDLVN